MAEIASDLSITCRGIARTRPPVGPLTALAAVVLGGVAARAWLLFSTPLVPGMNGGYYLVQARALLEKGTLGIPDLPLTFALQAGFAKMLYWAMGGDLSSRIVLAVKLADAVLPPLAAAPVFLLGYGWSRRLQRGPWLAVVAAAAVSFGGPSLSMTGDFQKNALGLVWLAGLLYALRAWMRQHDGVTTAATLALLALCGLTHIGVFGSALLLTGMVLGVHIALRRRDKIS